MIVPNHLYPGARVALVAASSAVEAQRLPAALDAVITGLKDAGYELVPISQLIYRDNYHIDHEGRQVPDAPPAA